MIYNQRRIIEKLASLSGVCFDTRWISVPIMSFLAYTFGDVSLWVIVLVLVASYKFIIKL